MTHAHDPQKLGQINQKKEELKSQTKGKPFKNWSTPDKEKLLEILATDAGLINEGG